MTFRGRDPRSRFARALVHSARKDAAPSGALARARARLRVEDVGSPASVGFAGALVLAAVTFVTAWSPSPVSVGVASDVTTAECRIGVEAPPCSCSDSPSGAVSSGTISGSSSGTAFSRGGSGGG
jgi:hypothetical protein